MVSSGPLLDGNIASFPRYASGATYTQKGVAHSHRSTILHAYTACPHNAMGLSARDVVCPVVPMCHVNARGMAYSAAAPSTLIRAFRVAHGVDLIHAWGMSETSPLGTVGELKCMHLTMPEYARHAMRVKQGGLAVGMEMKIVDGQGVEPPRDGHAVGDLLVRRPWIAAAYFKNNGTRP